MTGRIPLSEAERMIAGVRTTALDLFPDNGAEVFDLIYLPRFRRALRESGLLVGRRLHIVRERVADDTCEDTRRKDEGSR